MTEQVEGDIQVDDDGLAGDDVQADDDQKMKVCHQDRAVILKSVHRRQGVYRGFCAPRPST